MKNTAPIGILALVAIIGIVALIANFYGGPTQMVIVRGPGSDTVTIEGVGVNELIANEGQTIDSVYLDGLRSGTVRGRTGSTYRQYIRMGNLPGFAGGRVRFERDERDVLNDYLVFDDAVYEYALEFDGLTSELDGTKMVDVEDEDIYIMGNSMSIADTYINGNQAEIDLFGGFGSIRFSDNNIADTNYQSYGLSVNGQNVDADVRIIGTNFGGARPEVVISSIEVRLNAQGAVGGDVYVPANRCVREFLKYPQGMLVPNFDICFGGIGAEPGIPTHGLSGNEVQFKRRGSTGYWFNFINNQGKYYKLPFYDTTGGAHYGDRDGRITHFKEANNPGAFNINLNDFIVVNSRDEISGVTNVGRYQQHDAGNSKVYFIDLAGNKRTASYDPATGQSQLNLGTGTYRFFVNPANGMIAMDQTGDGNINGARAPIVLQGGHKIETTAGFVAKLVTPARLREEAIVDEVTNMNLVGNDIVIPSPQGDFRLIDVEGSTYQGMTQYGILVTQNQGDTPSNVDILIPTSYSPQRRTSGQSLSGIIVTLNRAGFSEPSFQTPAQQNICGNGKINEGEECDPPGTICKAIEKGITINGICKSDCQCKWFYPEPVCGNGLIEEGEQCERDADCIRGKCVECQCIEVIQPVCGNRILEEGEECELDSECMSGEYCSNCKCKAVPVAKPEVQEPTKIETVENEKGGFFYNIWMWMRKLFWK